jgi:uncharacterized membrane protein YbaN (DUF454 family)
MSGRAQAIAAAVGMVMILLIAMLLAINIVAGLILGLLTTTSFLLVGFTHRRPRLPRMEQEQVDAEFWRIADQLRAAPYRPTPHTEETA